MASFNKVVLVGNLTRDPDVRHIPSGQAVCDISLAINSQWTDRKTNERKEEVTFVDVTLWGRTAEIAGEYLAKGRPVLIEGKLAQDTWEDKTTGQKRSKLKVIADSLQLLGNKQDGERQAAPTQSRERQPSGQRQAEAPQYAEYDHTPDDNSPF